MIGIFCGFVGGLLTIYGIKDAVDHVGGLMDGGESERPENEVESAHGTVEYASIELARTALSLPRHRDHIREHLEELKETVALIESNTQRVIDGELVSKQDEEDTFETIDKKVHELQYVIDHTRRLIQGNEAQLDEGNVEKGIKSESKKFFQSAVSPEQKITIANRLKDIKDNVAHVLQHIDGAEEIYLRKERTASNLSDDEASRGDLSAMSAGEGSQIPLMELDDSVMVEIDHHMEELDEFLSQFHEAIANELTHWRYRGRVMPVTKKGDRIPPGLVTTIAADSLIDGFLIGLTTALSPTAGIVLASANVIEVRPSNIKSHNMTSLL